MSMCATLSPDPYHRNAALVFRNLYPSLQSQDNVSLQTQLIRRDAIRAALPLHHAELVVLLLPARRAPANEPLLAHAAGV